MKNQAFKHNKTFCKTFLPEIQWSYLEILEDEAHKFSIGKSVLLYFGLYAEGGII